ncbi:MAG TPA: terminase TerL endonuclease subunit [Allosphingosinicella sp.]|jgi:phage terminase large subunit-like protein
MAARKKKPSRADVVIEFIENLTITIGEDAGKPFKLRPWQARFIRDVYGPVDKKGRRTVRRAVLSVARKNGKTELAAALVLVHLIGPEAELNGEIYSAANDREQAAIVYNAVKRMIEAEPELQRHLTVVPSTKVIYVKTSGIRAEGSKFRALSADAGTKHGLNPSFIIYDELAQAKSRELFDTLTTSQGARAEPLFLTISTQSHRDDHVLTEMIEDALSGEDPTTVCHLYAADAGCDVMDEAQWAKANPALGDFRSFEDVRVKAAEAKRLPSCEPSFRLLFLNQRVSTKATLIRPGDWKACAGEVEFEPGEPIYLGLDLSDRVDLTALVAVSAQDGSRVKAFFWKPEAELIEHARRDRTPYDAYHEHGWLSLSPGRSINPKFVALKVAELFSEYEVRGLAYDRWRIDEFLRHLDDTGLHAHEGQGSGLRIVPWGQGYRDMAPAVDAFETSVLEEELRHDGNPLLTFCVMNAQVTSDGPNRKLNKEESRFRIDGAVALAMALGLKARDRSTPTPQSPWEDPEFDLTVV